MDELYIFRLELPLGVCGRQDLVPNRHDCVDGPVHAQVGWEPLDGYVLQQPHVQTVRQVRSYC